MQRCLKRKLETRPVVPVLPARGEALLWTQVCLKLENSYYPCLIQFSSLLWSPTLRAFLLFSVNLTLPWYESNYSDPWVSPKKPYSRTRSLPPYPALKYVLIYTLIRRCRPFCLFSMKISLQRETSENMRDREAVLHVYFSQIKTVCVFQTLLPRI